MKHVRISQEFGFEDLIISVKSTSVPLMIEAYRLISERTDFPLHLGVTEAGRIRVGTIKSAIGIGTLLAEGIGDTIRVSLLTNPKEKLKSAKKFYVHSDMPSVMLKSSPALPGGRLDVDLFKITEQIEEAVKDIKSL